MNVGHYDQIITVYFFDTKTQMNKVFSTHGDGISFAKSQLAAFVFSRTYNGFTKHEISHVLSINTWGGSALWIEEGFATLCDEDLQSIHFHAQAQKILETSDFIPIDRVMNRFKSYNGNWYRYVEAASLLKYMKEKYGHELFVQTWKTKKVQGHSNKANQIIDDWLQLIKLGKF